MHERIIALYKENALAWDAERGRDLHEKPWLDRFAAQLPRRAHILDLGCGAGEPIARHLIERGFRVTGLDSAPPLVALCRERFPDQEWLVGDMRTLGLGRTYDGLLACHSFLHLSAEDQRAMFARFAVHPRGGGALMFTSGPEAGESISRWQGEPLFHASLDPAEYRALLAANGFEVVESRLSDPDCGHSTVWLARKTAGSVGG